MNGAVSLIPKAMYVAVDYDGHSTVTRERGIGRRDAIAYYLLLIAVGEARKPTRYSQSVTHKVAELGWHHEDSVPSSLADEGLF